MQRILDVLISFFLLVLLSPVFLISFIVLSVTGEREIFYTQKRIGLAGHPFDLIKFATMYKNSPSYGSKTITIDGDPRILPFGKFLRATKINELPQLFNVLKGQMSLIGPRPLTIENFNYYSPSVQSALVQVRPGVSGIGSIVFRSENIIIGSGLDYEEKYKNLVGPYKGELELWYVNNKSLFIYLLLSLLTLIVIFNDKTFRLVYLVKGVPKPPDNLRDLLPR